MMKNIALMLIAFFVLSCSNDTNEVPFINNNTPTPLYEIKLPKTITLSTQSFPAYDRKYDFTYDNRNRLVSTKVTGDLTAAFDYSYNEFQMVSVTVNNTNTFTISYDTSGRLSGVTNNGVTTPITFDSATGLYTYGTRTFTIKEKDIKTFNADTFLLVDPPFQGPFYSVLGYNNFAALLTDDKMLNFATRRVCSNLFHPTTHESQGMAFSIHSNEYFWGGYASFSDDSHLMLHCVFIEAWQYEDIDRL